MIQNFFYYGFPDYSIEKETPYDYMNKYKPNRDLVDKEIGSQYLAPKILVNFRIINPIMLLPTFGSKNVVVAQITDVNVMYLREKEEEVPNEEERAGEMKYVFHQLELYTCKLEDLISKSSFLAVQKRRILEPMQLYYQCITNRSSKFKFNHKVSYEVEKLTFTVSHRDILLLSSVASVQSKVLSFKKRLIQRLSVYPKQALDHSVELDQSTGVEYSLSGVNILIINDAMGAYCPILDFNCQPCKIIVQENKNL